MISLVTWKVLRYKYMYLVWYIPWSRVVDARSICYSVFFPPTVVYFFYFQCTIFFLQCTVCFLECIFLACNVSFSIYSVSFIPCNVAFFSWLGWINYKNVCWTGGNEIGVQPCLLYTSPSPRDGLLSRMPSSA